MFCWKCGKEYSEDMNFCPYCGESKTKNEEKKDQDSIDKLMNYKYKYKSGDRAELKAEAKEALKNGTWFMLFIIIVLINAVFSLLSTAVIGIVFAGLYTTAVFFVTKQVLIYKKVDFETIYKPFTKIKDFGSFLLKSFGISLLVFILVLVGTILFVIPGIYFALCYSQALYLLADDPELSVSDAMAKSKSLMDGHKWEFFILQLSFIPTYFLTLITFAVYSIYGVPYVQTVNTNYYFYLRGLDANNKIDYIG